VHQVQRVAVRDPRSGGEGRLRTVDEGDLEVHAGKFEIPYGSIVPRPGEVSNLLVPTCIASTHLAYGAYRLESPYMVVGHSSGVAAFLALAEQVAVQSINVSQLTSLLRDQGQILTLREARPAPPHHLPGSSDTPLSLGGCDDPDANFTYLPVVHGGTRTPTGVVALINRNQECASVMGYSTGDGAVIVAAKCHTADTSPRHRNQEFKPIAHRLHAETASLALCLLMASKDGCSDANNQNQCLAHTNARVVLEPCSSASAQWNRVGDKLLAVGGAHWGQALSGPGTLAQSEGVTSTRCLLSHP
jgi:hypothetical protein